MTEQKENKQIYGYPVAVHELAEKYIKEHILKCDTMLVEALIEESFEEPYNSLKLASKFHYEDIENIYYISPKWIRDLTTEQQDLLKLYNFRTMEDFSDFMDDCETSDKAYDSDGNNVSINEEHWEILEDIHYVWKHRDSESQEVFEWWAVTQWLSEQLIMLGEPVLTNEYGYWWGRTCTGQAIILDGTIQGIAKKCYDYKERN